MAAPPDSKSDKSPEELLCAAAEAGNDDAIAELISTGADPTYFDASGMTPLMRAATGGHPPPPRAPRGLSAGDLTSDPATYDLLLDHALRSELILGTVARRQAAPANSSDGVPAETYLDSRVSFSEDRVMDAESKAVMMEWERPLMEAHARAVCAAGGGKVLNVGFGMGLVDQAMQRYEPEEHTIIEAHPEVYARMLKLGWGEKKNVRILFGRWQDVIPQLGSYDVVPKVKLQIDSVSEVNFYNRGLTLLIKAHTFLVKKNLSKGGSYDLIEIPRASQHFIGTDKYESAQRRGYSNQRLPDLHNPSSSFLVWQANGLWKKWSLPNPYNCYIFSAYAGIFFDTYGEYYEDMREFHEHLPKLLRPGGVYSYFNGLCGDNAFFHVVYCQLVAMELASLGYSTQFVPLPVKDCLKAEVWEGVKQKYWQLDTYHLPVCQAESESE
ncbi:hypothetical protein TRIUR3_10016 [Triticum urartu]|uniref:Uncharacterized protein n=1 Tax=Triticum urartu TaxID=4572 RepID=M7Z5H5_TRIUA|nr:hypothetical protein TRIUR3_10016 [Triticum urartu]